MTVRHIHRDDFHPLGVRGVMEGGGVVLQTLEDPRDLIPAGEHECTKSWYYRGEYATYEIHVPGRSRILFHRGNTHRDTEGCVLVGMTRGMLHGEPAVLGSRQAFAAFMDSLEGVEAFTLLITEGDRASSDSVD